MSDTAERMSRVDTAWLRMDNDVNLMMIVGVWLLQPGITHEALCERIEDSAAEVRRAFARRWCRTRSARAGSTTRTSTSSATWCARSCSRKRGQSERAALQARAGELATTPLDPAHPLWQFHLIEHYDGGSACIARIHHCIGDGIALISVMMSITDGGTEPPQRKRERRRAHEDDWLSDAVIKPLTDLTVKAHRHVRRAAWRKSMDMLAHPQQLLGSLRPGAHRLPGAARRGGAGADARRFADAAQGQAGRPASSSPGASRCRWTRSRPSARR